MAKCTLQVLTLKAYPRGLYNVGAYVMRVGFQGMPYYSFYKDSKGTLPEIVQGSILSGLNQQMSNLRPTLNPKP